MKLHKKVVSTENPKKRRWLPLLALLAVPFTGLYLNNKKVIDRALIKAGDKVIDFTKSSHRDSAEDKNENVRKINLKDIKKEVEPEQKVFSYESAETDPKVMGDIQKMHKKQQSDYQEWLATRPKKHRVEENQDAQVIADAYGIRVQDLKDANPQIKKEDWKKLKPGQELNIIYTAGGNLAPTAPYSEKIPEVKAAKKVNKNKKAKKETKLTKAGEIKKLKKIKKENKEKVKAVDQAIALKKSPEATKNPEVVAQKVNQTIEKAPFTVEEEAALKKMAKETKPTELEQASISLEKKQKALNDAIRDKDPKYYWNFPPEAFDLTVPYYQRHRAFAWYQLNALNENGTLNADRLEAGIQYFLSQSNMVNNLTSDFFYKGKRMFSSDVFDRLDELYGNNNLYSLFYPATWKRYEIYWSKWLEAFPGRSKYPKK